MSQDINNYYGVSNIVNDDIETVAFLIQILRLKPNDRIVCNLENLRLDKYSQELDLLLDIKTGTLKELQQIFNNKNRGK